MQDIFLNEYLNKGCKNRVMGGDIKIKIFYWESFFVVSK